MAKLAQTPHSQVVQMRNQSADTQVTRSPIESLQQITEKLQPTQQQRLNNFIKESDLFLRDEEKLGPTLNQWAEIASPDERDRLAQVLSRGTPLSTLIIEDRGE